jgi:hypothetical protein
VQILETRFWEKLVEGSFWENLENKLKRRGPLSSIAQCVAVLCLAAGDQKCASTIEMLKGILKDDSSANSVSFFS